MGRKTRQEMSGLFDFFKKKGPDQRSLFPLPPAASQLPAPLEERKRTPFSILKPEPGTPASPKSPGFFAILAPKRHENLPAPAGTKPPSAPAVVFPKAEEEKGEVRDIFKGVLRPVAPPPPTTRYVFISPSGPPETTSARTYGLPAPAERATEWTLPTPSQLAEHFKKSMDLPAVWDMLREVRRRPEFKKDQLIYSWQGSPMVIPVDPVVYQEFYTDFANFYGVPWSVIGQYLSAPSGRQKEADEALWNNVLSPLNSMVPEAFEILKPPDLPGFFNVTFIEPTSPPKEGDVREYWLFYVEPMLENPALPAGGSGGS